MTAWLRSVIRSPVGRRGLVALGAHLVAYPVFFLLRALPDIGERTPGTAGWQELAARLGVTDLAATVGAKPLMVLGWVLVVAAHLLALRWARAAVAEPYRRAWLAGLFAVIAVPMLVLPQLGSADVYAYMGHARVAVVHGGNPLVDALQKFPSDPLYTWFTWRERPSVYGPTWVSLSVALVHGLEQLGADLATYLLGFKLLAMLLQIGTAVLIWRLLARWAPERQLESVALFLLSPVLTFELTGNAHNDAAALFFVVLALAFHERGRRGLAMAALTLSALTKFHTAPFLAIYGGLVLRAEPGWRRRGVSALQLGAVVCGVTVACYLPYWRGVETLTAFRQAGQIFTSSWLVSLAQLYGLLTGHVPSNQELWPLVTGTVRWAFYLAVAGGVAGALVVRSSRQACAAFTLVFWAFCLTTPVFYPWYTTPLLAFAAATGHRSLGRMALWATTLGVAQYFHLAALSASFGQPYHLARYLAPAALALMPAVALLPVLVLLLDRSVALAQRQRESGGLAAMLPRAIRGDVGPATG